MTIKVYLDTSANPPVTVEPDCHPVNQGNHTITWVPGAQQSFTFQSLSIIDPPAPNPFGTPDVQSGEITLSDDNTNGGNVTDYQYEIVVSYNNQSYSSKTNGISGGSGNPSIKNH